MSSHSCEKGVPKNMCVACGIEADEARERDKQRKEDTRILFAAPEIQEEIKREVAAERAQRKKDRESDMHKMFYAIKRSEEAEMLLDIEKRKAGGVKQLTWDEARELRTKFPGSHDNYCSATADHNHNWSPLIQVGNSWHGPVLSKDCHACGYNWGNH